MIEVRLSRADLTRVRFAHAPLWEVAGSLRVLAEPRARLVHGPWRAAVRPRLAGLDTGDSALLRALVPPGPYVPDFLTPPPTGPGGLERDLAAVADAPDEQVRRDLDLLYAGRPLPHLLRPLHADPRRHLPRVVAALREYWDAALAPDWPRIRSVLDADVAHRAARLGSTGLGEALHALHPSVRFDGAVLRVDLPRHRCLRTLSGEGLVLAPCFFAWPGLMVVTAAPHTPTLTYPPRGAGRVWEPQRQPPAALAGLLGRTRAALLSHLDLPQTTTQLAGGLGISLPAASQHLAVLRGCGLVASRRSGRHVLHERTALGTELVSGADPPHDAQQGRERRRNGRRDEGRRRDRGGRQDAAYPGTV